MTQRALILTAHPQSASFTAQWADASAAGLRDAGHEVTVCDLYRADFDPVLRDRPEALIAAAQAADIWVFHFPIWWFGPPAILKGWFDRVLAAGDFHAPGQRFETGLGRGKRALFCVSAGASAEECGPSGREGDLRLILWPLAHALRYCGIAVLEPYIAPGIHDDHSPAARILMQAQIAQLLAGHPGRIGQIARLPVWASNPDSDFDATGRLTQGAPVFSPFIRHDDGS